MSHPSADGDCCNAAFAHSLIPRGNSATVELDLIVTEMLAFPSRSPRSKNDSNSINGKTTPI